MANTTMPNGTQYHTWKPEPLVRGTFSILSSSLLTMILCVWTSVHLNIPEPGGARAQMWRKTGWMVVAVLAPEWVVFTAYCEHLAADDIGKTMREAFDQPEPPGFVERLRILRPRKLLRLTGGLWNRLRHSISVGFWCTCYFIIYLARGHSPDPGRDAQHGDAEPDLKSGRHPWTQAHSLYSTMGGFVVDTRGMSPNYLPNGRERMTLTLQGLKFIAEKAPDLLPDLPESAIVDKSKANAFTKLVTCGQAVWFGIQCATRSAQGLSISLLEINTAVHAICTLIMYLHFWWHKPLDVEEPTMLTHVDTHSVIACLVITRRIRGVKVSWMDMEDDEHFDSALDSQDVIPHPRLKHIRLKRSKDPQFRSPYYTVYHGFAIPRELIHSTHSRLLTKVDFHHLKLASESARKYKLDETDVPMTTYLKVRLRNQPKIFDTDSDVEWHSSLLGFPLAGLLYGSVHLLVWNRPFRGETNELLWKISSLTILLSGVPLAVWVFCWALEKESWIPPYMRFAIEKFAWSLASCFMVFYIFCRAFIIVECFLDVFHLPDSAFEVPRWSQYFPHV